MPRARGRRRRRHHRLRTVLLAGMLVPVLGACVRAASAIGPRWSEREASRELAVAADDLGSLIDAVAATTEEQARTSVLVIGTAFDLEVPADTTPSLHRARALVDRATDSSGGGLLAPALAELTAMRAAFDSGTLGFEALSQSHVSVHGELAEVLDARLGRVESVADRGSQPAWQRARIRTLRESVAAVVPLTRRVRASLHVDLGDRASNLVTDLLRANAAFAEATSRVDPEPGTLAAAAWDADPPTAAAQS